MIHNHLYDCTIIKLLHNHINDYTYKSYDMAYDLDILTSYLDIM